MRRISRYITLALIVGAFGGGTWLGLWLNRVEPIEPLSTLALQQLRAKMAELGAQEPTVVHHYEKVLSEIPRDIAEEMVALAKAAGIEAPTTGMAFDLAPEDTITYEVQEGCPPPCFPQDVGVSGFAERLGDIWVWKGIMRYEPDKSEYGWTSDLKGAFIILEDEPVPQPKKWFAGPSIRTEIGGGIKYGGLGGRSWDHFMILGGVDSGGAWAGATFRFGR